MPFLTLKFHGKKQHRYYTQFQSVGPAKSTDDDRAIVLSSFRKFIQISMLFTDGISAIFNSQKATYSPIGGVACKHRRIILCSTKQHYVFIVSNTND